ncbi:1-deoxy-D-xylulose-5-phosphate reductoisomerase [Thiohalophilus thiocyanatoxydans]|uniref:1-deoxy-D-xylulose 5-phosphate reductoisomerase n=1 Tax=Thiohalophilus thiocyanatoxydans TaxID=381308 RepID=A0A4R8IRJ1_9GAMM|nr:1-deoxy-D-xylulose-5-phosphate reductoisomerase [Thiohalophilus thiocyanatoxydans]TDY00119.1 1-deoxy-D-xylulose 5-phosphate reductoisomerase [Thiohalophilus thiocyanatoxydans]
MKQVTLLGATGSIGLSTLDVIARHPEQFSVFALTANTQVDRLFQQCCDYQPEYAVMADPQAAEQLEQKLAENGLETQVLAGIDGLIQVASDAGTDYVMAAIVGAAGLQPTLAAARAGKRVLLANKEALVMSGRLFMDAIKENQAELLPIDSEHNAIFQCIPGRLSGNVTEYGVKRILLTGSGGPFRQTPLSQLARVTPEQAVAHPNWDMGHKISVDSATMMNKGLELIEACWLFEARPDFIQIVVHPQSVVHSMVEYTDGSILAQLGQPDMRTPIAHAMAWPERMDSGVDRLDLFDVARLDFERPDYERFPCLQLAEQAARQGGTAPAILNAANEVAVQAFLDGALDFTNIAVVVESVLSVMSSREADDLNTILVDDEQAREYAQESIHQARTRVE